MVLESLRRHDRQLDQKLRIYPFTDKPVLEIEQAADGSAKESAPGASLDRQPAPRMRR